MSNLLQAARDFLFPAAKVPNVPQPQKQQTQRANATTGVPAQKVAPVKANVSYTMTAEQLRRQRKISITEAAALVPSKEMQTLASDAWRKALPNPNGWCLRHAIYALNRCGLGIREGAHTAIAAAPAMQRDPNFVEITGVTIDNLDSLPMGCLILYEKPGMGISTLGSRAGHATISCGRGRYASDFRSDNNVFRGRPRDQYVFAFMPVHRGNFVFDPAQARAIRDVESIAGSGSYAADGTYTPAADSVYSSLESRFGWFALMTEYLRQQQERQRLDEDSKRKRNQELSDQARKTEQEKNESEGQKRKLEKPKAA